MIKNGDLYVDTEGKTYPSSWHMYLAEAGRGAPNWADLDDETKQRWQDEWRSRKVKETLDLRDALAEHVPEPAPTTRDALNEIINLTFDSIQKLNGTKGQEYAGDEDALENFRNRAAQFDLDPMQVWGVFAGKHWDAICAYIRRGHVLSEPIEGRIDDLVLYLILLKGLIRERGGEGS